MFRHVHSLRLDSIKMTLCLSILFAVVGVGMTVKCSNAFVLESADVDPNGIARSVVQIVRFGETICPGSIIDSFTVVTAEYCFLYPDLKNSSILQVYEVVYGSVERFDQENAGNFHRVPIRVDGFHHHGLLPVTVLSLVTEMIDVIPMKLDEQSSTQCDMPAQLYGFAKYGKVMQVMGTVVKSGCGDEWNTPNRIVSKADEKDDCLNNYGGPLVKTQTGQMVSIHIARSRICHPGDSNYSIKLSDVMDFIRTYCNEC